MTTSHSTHDPMRNLPVFLLLILLLFFSSKGLAEEIPKESIISLEQIETTFTNSAEMMQFVKQDFSPVDQDISSYYIGILSDAVDASFTKKTFSLHFSSLEHDTPNNLGSAIREFTTIDADLKQHAWNALIDKEYETISDEKKSKIKKIIDGMASPSLAEQQGITISVLSNIARYLDDRNTEQLSRIDDATLHSAISDFLEDAIHEQANKTLTLPMDLRTRQEMSLRYVLSRMTDGSIDNLLAYYTSDKSKELNSNIFLSFSAASREALNNVFVSYRNSTTEHRKLKK